MNGNSCTVSIHGKVIHSFPFSLFTYFRENTHTHKAILSRLQYRCLIMKPFLCETPILISQSCLQVDS